MSLKRSRTGSFALVTQDSGFQSGASGYSSGGYAARRAKGYKKSYRKGTRMRPSNIASIVRSINWRQRETKMISFFQEERQMNTLSTLVDTLDFPVPAIGTAANQRVGNRIDGVGIKLKLLMHNNTSVPVHVRMLILKIPQGERFTNTQIAGELFEQSSPGTTPETGSLPSLSGADLIRIVNRGEIIVLRDKVIPLLGNTVDTGIAMEECYIRIPGRITFPDSAFSQQIGPRYLFCLLPRRSDNDENLAGSIVEYSFSVTTYFKDA
jgi:hypothetical protein